MESKRFALFAAGLALILTVPAEGQRKEPERLARQPARGLRGAVAAGSDFAVEAGMRSYHRGGNAVDAGVSAMLAASVAEFSHFGFGGEAPILIRTRDGKVVSIAGVGTMPKSATAEFFRNRRLKIGELFVLEPGGLQGMVPVAGLMPALVPGMVDAALLALRDYGTQSFEEVVGPAVDLCDGFPIDDARTSGLERSRRFFDLWPGSKKVFIPNGKVPRNGEIFRQADLARTLRSMVNAERLALAGGASRARGIDAVRDYFYRGEIAKRIDAFMRANGGLLRYEDMAAFKLEAEEPESIEYRGYKVHKGGFWGQGPVLLQTLKLLEASPMRAMGHNNGAYLHRIVEAAKLSYADRDTYYGDPRMAKVPVAKLLSDDYAYQRRALIDERASAEFRPGDLGGEHPSRSAQATKKLTDELAARDTTTVNAVDKDGIMFSATPSGSWIPAVLAGDTGIPLTQRAQSFLLIPGHPNELAGGKRPRVTLSPTIVTRAGKPYAVISTPGGDNQDQAILQIFLNAVEFGMDAQAAVEAPRFQSRHLVSSFDNHAMSPNELVLDERIPKAAAQELERRGHAVATSSRWASGSAPTMIRWYDGMVEAGADPYGYRVSAAW